MMQIDSLEDLTRSLNEVKLTNRFILKRLSQQEKYFQGENKNLEPFEMDLLVTASSNLAERLLTKITELEEQEHVQDQQMKRLMNSVKSVSDRISSLCSLITDSEDVSTNKNLKRKSERSAKSKLRSSKSCTSYTRDEVTHCSTDHIMVSDTGVQNIGRCGKREEIRDSEDKLTSGQYVEKQNSDESGSEIPVIKGLHLNKHGVVTVKNIPIKNLTRDEDTDSCSTGTVLESHVTDPESYVSRAKTELHANLTDPGVSTSHVLRQTCTRKDQDNRFKLEEISEKSIFTRMNEANMVIGEPEKNVEELKEEKLKADKLLFDCCQKIEVTHYLESARIQSIESRGLKHIRGKGLDTVFVLDTSESMAGEGLRQIQSAFSCFMEEIEGTASFGDEENIAVITFGKEIKVLEHLSKNYHQIRQSVGELVCGGASPLLAALMMTTCPLGGGAGVNVLNGWHVRPRIILMTDGHITSSEYLHAPENPYLYDKSELQTRIVGYLEHMNGSQIHCIPVGNPDMEFLEMLSALTKGQIVHLHEVGRKLGRFYLNMKRASRLKVIENADWDSMPASYIQHRVQMLEIQCDGNCNCTEEDVEEIRAIFGNAEVFKSDDSDEDLTDEEAGMPSFGTRVRRGKDWRWGNQDSGNAGTVIGHEKGQNPGWILVEWDSTGDKFCYRYGADGCIDLDIVDEPRHLGDKLIAVGCCVCRGKDWEGGDKDGGDGNIGTVYEVKMNGKVKVRWSNGNKGIYRYGFDGNFDLEICSSLSRRIRPKTEDLSSYERKRTTMPTSAVCSRAQTSDTSVQRGHVINVEPQEYYSTSDLAREDDTMSIYDMAPPVIKDFQNVTASDRWKGARPKTTFKLERKKHVKSQNKISRNVSNNTKTSEDQDKDNSSHRKQTIRDIILENDTSTSNQNKDGCHSKQSMMGDLSKENKSDEICVQNKDVFYPKQPVKETTDCNKESSKMETSNCNVETSCVCVSSNVQKDIENEGKLVDSNPRQVGELSRDREIGVKKVFYKPDASQREQPGDKPTSSTRSVWKYEDDTSSDSMSVISEVSSILSPVNAQWQWRAHSGTWISYSEEANQKIEKVFRKSPRSTALVTVQGQYFRVVLSKKIHINTITRKVTDIRRLDQSTDVANLSDVEDEH